MSVNKEQAMEAAVFLTIYKQAIDTLQQSAVRDASNEAIEAYTERIIQLSNNRQFRRFCNINDPINNHLSKFRHGDLIKDVRAFQFSHYVFSKYLPLFMGFQGNSKEIAKYIREQTNTLQRDIQG